MYDCFIVEVYQSFHQFILPFYLYFRHLTSFIYQLLILTYLSVFVFNSSVVSTSLLTIWTFIFLFLPSRVCSMMSTFFVFLFHFLNLQPLITITRRAIFRHSFSSYIYTLLILDVSIFNILLFFLLSKMSGSFSCFFFIVTGMTPKLALSWFLVVFFMSKTIHLSSSSFHNMST